MTHQQRSIELATATDSGDTNEHRNDRSRRVPPGHADQGDRRRRRRRQRGRAHDRPRRAGRGVHLRQHRRAGAGAQRARTRRSSSGNSGLGAGSKPEKGREAAEAAVDDIREAIARRAHAVHHRRHGRRHRHRRGAGDRARRQGDGHPDGGRGDQAVRLRRRPAHEQRRPGPGRARSQRRLADRRPQREAARGAGRRHHAGRGLRARQRRAEQRRRRHRRNHQRARPRQRRLRGRAHRDGRAGQGDDGHGRGQRPRPRAHRRRAGGGLPAAGGHRPVGRQGRAGADHRGQGQPEAARVQAGDEHHPRLRLARRARDLRHGLRRRPGRRDARDGGGDRPVAPGRSAARRRRCRCCAPAPTTCRSTCRRSTTPSAARARSRRASTAASAARLRRHGRAQRVAHQPHAGGGQGGRAVLAAAWTTSRSRRSCASRRTDRARRESKRVLQGSVRGWALASGPPSFRSSSHALTAP